MQASSMSLKVFLFFLTFPLGVGAPVVGVGPVVGPVAGPVVGVALGAVGVVSLPLVGIGVLSLDPDACWLVWLPSRDSDGNMNCVSPLSST